MEKNKKLEISAEDALNAYNNTDANGRELLEHLFGDEVFKPKNIMERVKTYEDACAVLGLEPKDFGSMRFVEVDDEGEMKADTVLKFMPDEIAYFKLKTIAKALNEGWKPQFTEDERRWYPYFWLYTKEEYDRLNADEKKACRVVGRAYSSANVHGGVVYAIANFAWSYSHRGSRLAFKSEELAEYCGKQFIDIWMEFLIG